MTKTKKLTLSAMLTALAFVLVLVSQLLPAPWTQGGYITLASMVPIILVSIIIYHFVDKSLMRLYRE